MILTGVYRTQEDIHRQRCQCPYKGNFWWFCRCPRGFDFRDRNGGGTSLLELVKDLKLVISNSCFSKKDQDHLVDFCNITAKIQIDYLLLRRVYPGLCKDCKVISSENFMIQRKILL